MKKVVQTAMFLIMVLVGSSQLASAATIWSVDRTGDSAGDGSATIGTLRYCLSHAANGDTINFQTLSGPIVAASELPVLTSVTINGVTGNTEIRGLLSCVVEIWSSNCVIRNLALNTGGVGIILNSGSGTTIQGCRIGTDWNDTPGLGFTYEGIRVWTDNNLIGGSMPGEGNVLSGNTNDSGLSIVAGANNQIIGNKIGTNAAGTAALPNDYGIWLWPNIGATSIHNNIISGNNCGISGSTSRANISIYDNYIGVNAAGTAAIGNNTYGIYLDHTDQVTLTGNIISGNQRGIYAFHGSQLAIHSNYIGTDHLGTSAIPNTNFGINLIGCFNTNIGTAGGNVIAANPTNVSMSSCTSTAFCGNIVGLDASANHHILAGSQIGIMLSDNSWGNIIGSAANGQYNIIGGNTVVGLDFAAFGGNLSSNVVQNNWIGMTPAGQTRPNGTGIRLMGYGNLVGGNRGSATTQEYNVIAGNNDYGIHLSSGSGNTICGNYIGVSPNHPGSFRNLGLSVYIDAPNNTLGLPQGLGPNQIYGNVIVGEGINLTNKADYTTVQGNTFGLSADGLAKIDSTTSVFSAASHCTFGGATDACRNIFFGASPGIQLNSAHYNIINKNWFGVLANGSYDSGLQPMGTAIVLNDSQNNTIGALADSGNLMTNLLGEGIYVSGSNAYNNAFWGNAIYGFASPGTGIRIFLVNHGNQDKSAPQILGYNLGTASISGTSQAGDYIELFKADRGAGKAGGAIMRLASQVTASDGTWSISGLSSLAEGDYVCAIATNQNNNSSGFSQNFCYGPMPTFTPTPTPTATQVGGAATPSRTPTPNITMTTTPTAIAALPSSTPTSTATVVNTFGKKVLVYPNPAKTEMKFLVNLEQSQVVKVSIYNLVGERQALLQETLPAGSGLVTWKCGQAAPGVYVARVAADGNAVATMKVAVVKQ